MSKIKLFIGIVSVLILGLVMVGPVMAATVVQIQSLPGVINYTDFKLSCTSNGGSAQFYSKKDGSSYVAFGSSINLSTTPCQVNVNGNQFGSEGKFFFKVVVDGSFESETSTTLDTTAPGSVSDFGKERIGGGTGYRLRWKNPTNSDYKRVFIYRGTVPGFESDGNKIAEAGGGPGDAMTYDDGSLDPTKEYYYYIRALDEANNASGLVGDTSTTTVVSPGSGTSGTSGRVTSLPQEQGSGGGSVLGTEATPTAEAESVEPSPDGGIVDQVNQFASGTPEPFKWILTHKKISLGVLAILGIIGYYFFKASREK